MIRPKRCEKTTREEEARKTRNGDDRRRNGKKTGIRMRDERERETREYLLQLFNIFPAVLIPFSGFPLPLYFEDDIVTKR